jgi:ATP-dependent helicase/nuclease subunit A
LLESALQNLFNSKSYDDIKNNLDVSIPIMPRGSEEKPKAYRKEICDIINDIDKICVWANTDEIRESIYSTKEYVKSIIEIVTLLDKSIKDYKFENDLYEFSDIANISIKLIKENDDVREELRNYFHEILVDEYQDTNDLQEEFISFISNNNNVYMVGDIKQSIYRLEMLIH